MTFDCYVEVYNEHGQSKFAAFKLKPRSAYDVVLA